MQKNNDCLTLKKKIMQKKIFFFVLFVSVGGLTAMTAQVIHAGITAAGGNATGTGGSASYSVGQLVYTTATGSNGSVAQGVQQPYEINVISGIEDIYGIELFMAYPNPVGNSLILKIENNELDLFSYQLYNLTGSLIRSSKISSLETSINMAELIPSTYFLRIYIDNKEVKTFKIIKN